MAHAQETRFLLSSKRMSPFKSVGASVQSTTGSRAVGISVSNAGYTTFRVRVRVMATHSIRQFPPSLPLPVRHSVPSGSERALLTSPLGQQNGQRFETHQNDSEDFLSGGSNVQRSELA